MSLNKKGRGRNISELSFLVADDVGEQVNLVENVVNLLENDNTVAFIARYRRNEIGHLQVDTIRLIQESLNQVKVVENRKETVLKAIGEHATPEIKQYLKCARTLPDVEEIYAPFKKGAKGTLANRARSLGLDKAAMMINRNPKVANLHMFVKPHEKGLSNPTEVAKGVQHIMADEISKDKDMWKTLKNIYESSHVTLDTKVSKNNKDDKKYKEYHDKTLPVNRIKSHQVLALNRAEGNKIIQVKVSCSPNVSERFLQVAKRTFITGQCSDFVNRILSSSVEDCLSRLMLPKIARHKRAELTKKAEREAVQVFSRNLRHLLLTPPVRNRTVLGIDPGFSHGCKLAVVDGKGGILATDVIHPFSPKSTPVAEVKLQCLLTEHNCSTIALGNRTACRETELFITKMKESGKLKKELVYSIVCEDGASFYSVSKEAEAEMPDLDINLRSAVSIARRLQDPLLELIKTDPKHLGIGMYQHDMPDQLLKSALDGVLEDCMSLVGVDLNTSNVYALRRIAGLSEKKAKAIIDWRKKHGQFYSREELKCVTGIGEKTFEQCAGFVRIMPPTQVTIVLSSEEENDQTSFTGQKKRKAKESGPGKKKRKVENPTSFNRLDSTSIHPESYPIAERLMAFTKAGPNDIGKTRMKEEIDNLLKTNDLSSLSRQLNTDTTSLRFIINGLCQSCGHDLRADFGEPLFRAGVLSVNDLKQGVTYTGRIGNVTTFGAFVDLGVEYNGLIHCSKMRNDISLGVGDIVEVVVENIDKEQKRLALRLLRVKNQNVELR